MEKDWKRGRKRKFNRNVLFFEIAIQIIYLSDMYFVLLRS